MTDVDFWVNRQGDKIDNLPIGGAEPSWLKHVEKYFPKTINASFLEIGVVPGSVLFYLDTHINYKVAGLDFSPRVCEVKAFF